MKQYAISLIMMLVCAVSICIAAPSNSLVSYLKAVENGNRVGYRDGRWYTHMVLGVPHIGYGHKITGREKYPDGLDDAQVEALLNEDIEDAANQCAREIPEWSTLDEHRQDMLKDFAFNLGTTKGFPKFVRAVVNNDKPGMEREYRRYAKVNGKRVELKARNKAFKSTFLR